MSGRAAKGADALRTADTGVESIAYQVAALLAVDPNGLAGAVLRGPADPKRDEWLEALRKLLPTGAPWRRVPLGIADSRLLGGLDLAASLSAGRPIAQAGLLAEADGGIIILPMAERVESQVIARIAAVLDHGALRVAREGITVARATRFGVIALDEGITEDEQVAEALSDRLAFRLCFGPAGLHGAVPVMPRRAEIEAARLLLAQVKIPADLPQAFCAAALALGIPSLRAPVFAMRCARAAAALAGRMEVTREDAALAAQLILAPRARQVPEAPVEEQEQPPEQQQKPSDADTQQQQQQDPPSLEDLVLAAAQASLPAGLLAGLGVAARQMARQAGSSGRSGMMRRSAQRGRPIGARPAALRAGLRFALVETLRVAAPWQEYRRREKPHHAAVVHIRREDVRIRRYKQNSETTTIFLVDASGSAALHRLAEAKGAVELLLADCYVRRDRVAVIAFRGRGAEVLLEPTHSLVRAKRSLAALPGGGGTPLAAGIAAGYAMAEASRKRGQTPVIVALTDGRANVTRDGLGGRATAESEALDTARLFRASGIAALLIDTAPRPQAFSRDLASAMGARYVPLPFADAARMSSAVRQAARVSASGP
ncbi:MAG: magnesium chelatase subunit D [Roseomonas sp.]|nr:magnesium chelatase subunit D [Roseomonas sp.]MCA3456473.1 magnesium chelatase subunit D [Rhodobacter sp.]MCA3328783.1 magnesium chelatase subunit D [Roseomonas sp.]MCA3330411.1 magnesium chelatase subunit D [Roseomonas sp.]MCA3335138.1 magnesium chelatase subunit D [Roseomonas sp.]